MKDKRVTIIVILVTLNILTLYFMQSLGMFDNFSTMIHLLFNDIYYLIITCILWIVCIITNFIYIDRL